MYFTRDKYTIIFASSDVYADKLADIVKHEM